MWLFAFIKDVIFHVMLRIFSPDNSHFLALAKVGLVQLNRLLGFNERVVGLITRICVVWRSLSDYRHQPSILKIIHFYFVVCIVY